MSLEIIKKEIKRFISSTNPEVLAIKGYWGVGKTYTWNTFLSQAKNENKIGLQKYSYVSLFGVSSLDSLKHSIFENTVDKSFVGDEINVKTFQQNISNVLDASPYEKGKNKLKKIIPNKTKFWRKSIKYIDVTQYMSGLTSSISSIPFLSLNKHLICIDDFERRGDDIGGNDILGLVSLLKEQKKCKIVMLLNEGEMKSEDYKKYREKVIDVEILFDPTPKESCDIAFNGKSDEIYENMRECAAKLDLKNIRILQKIDKIYQLLKPFLDSHEPELKVQAAESLAQHTTSWQHVRLIRAHQ